MSRNLPVPRNLPKSCLNLPKRHKKSVRPKKDKFYLAKINKGQRSRKKAKNYKFGLKKAKLATLHTATVLRRWREATNSSASMKMFHCYDIDNFILLIPHHWLDRQAALGKIAMKMCGVQQDFVTWKICQEASADMRDQQITFKPNCFKNFWKRKDRFGFEWTAETIY